MTTKQSEFVASLEARKAKTRTFDCSFLSDGSTQIGPVAFRVPTFGDELRAKLWAAEWIQNNERDDARIGNENLSSIQTACIIASTLSKPGDPFPVFVSPQQMWDRLSHDELSALAQQLNETRELYSLMKRELEPEEAEIFMKALSELDDEEAAVLLGDKDREWLFRFCLYACRTSHTM